MNLTFGTSLLLLAGASAFPAQAQYRAGVPETLAPPPRYERDHGAEAAMAFRQAYGNAGKPRMAVLWNRSFDDRLATQYEASTEVHQKVRTSSAAEWSRGGRRLDTAGAADRSISVSSGERAVDTTAGRPALVEGADWEIESAFTGRLRSAGIALIDRAVAMRTRAAIESPGDRRDVQTVETNALLDKSDLFVEVLQTLDPGAPFGLTFRVDVKNIHSGEILASVVSDGKAPPAPRGRFVATSNGFAREQAPAQTPAAVGEVLATKVLGALAGRWRS